MPSSDHPAAEFARHDPALCLAPGIFRSLPRGAAHRSRRAEIVYEHGGYTLRFVLPFLLGADDLRLLQVLVSLAGSGRQRLPIEPQTAAGRALKDGLGAQPDGDALTVRARLSGVLRALDHPDCPDSRNAIRRSLIRLASVVVIAARGSRDASAHLLSHAVDAETGELLVALDPRVTVAVLGTEQYVHIDLDEVRALRSDLAVIIHQRLCAWIDPGRTRKASIDTLTQYAFPEPAATASARAKRTRRVRAAMARLADVGWTVSESKHGGMYAVGRPRLPDQTPCLRDQSPCLPDQRPCLRDQGAQESAVPTRC